MISSLSEKPKKQIHFLLSDVNVFICTNRLILLQNLKSVKNHTDGPRSSGSHFSGLCSTKADIYTGGLSISDGPCVTSVTSRNSLEEMAFGFFFS